MSSAVGTLHPRSIPNMSQIESRTTNTGGNWKRMLNRADLIRTVLTVALFAIMVALSLNADFYNSSMVDAFMALALGSALITLLVVQPSWINLASVFLSSVVLAALDYRVLRFQPRFMAAFS